ncbi:MAG: ChaN family lipoprotein [Xanthomonadaceae bacterium]|nr:ChaN family lipoprotein [Xanthomonadaceae bacterium]
MIGLFLLLFMGLNSQAGTFEPEQLYFGKSGERASLVDLALYTPKGSTIIIGEYHDNVSHHDHQIALINVLIDSGHKVALGMEFLQTPFQNQVNEYLLGQLKEQDFLAQIGWGMNNFGLYREQIKLAYDSSKTVLAINAPSSLTSRVSKVGIDALSDEEKSLLPPDFKLGNDKYYQRFKDAMGEHVPAEKIMNYFQAQSIWDDTMAWNIASWRQNQVQQKTDKVTLVIIIGDFHVRYFGGTPDRLTQRTGMTPVVISQMNMQDLTDDEVSFEIASDPESGQRADFVWTSKE